MKCVVLMNPTFHPCRVWPLYLRSDEAVESGSDTEHTSLAGKVGGVKDVFTRLRVCVSPHESKVVDFDSSQGNAQVARRNKNNRCMTNN
jgi:hypothetical protein